MFQVAFLLSVSFFLSLLSRVGSGLGVFFDCLWVGGQVVSRVAALCASGELVEDCASSLGFKLRSADRGVPDRLLEMTSGLGFLSSACWSSANVWGDFNNILFFRCSLIWNLTSLS